MEILSLQNGGMVQSGQHSKYLQQTKSKPENYQDLVSLSPAAEQRDAQIKSLSDKYDPKNMNGQDFLSFLGDAEQAGLLTTEEAMRLSARPELRAGEYQNLTGENKDWTQELQSNISAMKPFAGTPADVYQKGLNLLRSML